MLNLGRLKVLSEVVSKGSFSAAAESLSYTQSAVSQAIARLESETGATLVVRDRRGVRPTPAGATLVTHAEEIFGRVEAAEADLAAVLGVRSGRLYGRRRSPLGAAGNKPLQSRRAWSAAIARRRRRTRARAPSRNTDRA